VFPVQLREEISRTIPVLLVYANLTLESRYGFFSYVLIVDGFICQVISPNDIWIYYSAIGSLWHCARRYQFWFDGCGFLLLLFWFFWVVNAAIPPQTFGILLRIYTTSCSHERTYFARYDPFVTYSGNSRCWVSCPSLLHLKWIFLCSRLSLTELSYHWFSSGGYRESELVSFVKLWKLFWFLDKYRWSTASSVAVQSIPGVWSAHTGLSDPASNRLRSPPQLYPLVQVLKDASNAFWLLL